jgi:hypothetical protein
MRKEEWRTVPSHPMYEISSEGRLRKYIPAKCVFLNGYLTVGITQNQKRTIHSLVAEAFIGPRPKGLVVNHIDHNKLNNHPSNLEYITQSRNATLGGLHRAKMGGYGMGEKSTRWLISDRNRARIPAMRASGWTYRRLAKKFNVSTGAISYILRKARDTNC